MVGQRRRLFAGRRSAVQARHDEVHQDDVRLGLLTQSDGLCAILGLRDELNIVKEQQDRLQPSAQEGVIVGDDDLYASLARESPCSARCPFRVGPSGCDDRTMVTRVATLGRCAHCLGSFPA